MAQSSLEVANAALYKLGAQPISTLSDNTKEAQACNARIEICKRAVLRLHPWNFATKRKTIYPPASVTLTTPFVTYVSSEVVRFTVASHTFVAGNYVTTASTGVIEGNGTFEVSSVTSTTITVSAFGVTSLTGTPAAGTIRLSPAFDFSYLYSLPSDCLRLLRVNDQTSSEDWRLEAGKILSDSDTLNVKYIYDVTDYTAMDALFYECFALYLAVDLSLHLGRDETTKQGLQRDLNVALAKARFADAVEDPAEQIGVNDWLSARGAGGGMNWWND